MKNAQVRVAIACYAYAGNGGYSSILPELAFWITNAAVKLKADPRVIDVAWEIFSDTPVDMMRCRGARWAKEIGADFLLMLDSDNVPDYEVGHITGAEPFLGKPFDFAYDRLVKQDLPTVIFAPYCGPPPSPIPPRNVIEGGEVPYLFRWTNNESDSPDSKWKIEMLNRREAALMKGIQPMAAGPTGVCLFATKCWEGMKHPYFYYEFTPDHCEKRSTEDVAATRDISMYWQMTKGVEVVFGAMDSWALHYKSKKVGKPKIVTIEDIGREMREAVIEDVSRCRSVENIDFTAELERGGTIGPQRITPATPAQIEAQRKQVAFGMQELEAPRHTIDPTKLKRRWDHLGPEDNEIYVSDEEWVDLLAVQRMEETSAPAEPVVLEEAQLASVTAAVETALEEPHKSNGKGIRYKMIGGRKVAIIDYELTDESIENVQALAGWLSNKMGSPIEAAVFHAGTGQGTAAIIDATPAFSRVFAFDSRSQYGLSQEYATQFEKAFEKEIESGKVKADVDSRAFPDVKGYSVDLVFIENFVTTSKLTAGAKLVAPAGLLCGTGYGSPDTKALVDAFATKYEWKVQVSGDIWAIPVGDIANAR